MDDDSRRDRRDMAFLGVFLRGYLDVRRPCRTLSQHGAGCLKVLRRIDAERHGIDDRYVDAHAGLQRAKLLQLLALFERRGRQLDEAFQRRPAIGVKPDVMIERAVAGGRGGAGEIERAQPAGRDGEPTTLTTFGLVRSSAFLISAASVAISTAGSSSGVSAAAMSAGAIVGRSPCTLTTISDPALRDRPRRAPRRCGRSRTGDRPGS